jgi:ribosomal protein L29|tara:strand:+ start:1723 stop:1935 length:213 start_codon:yes stop_codon:yes gene_type:complete
MSVLKYKEVQKMNGKEIDSKLKDLRGELIKSNVAANKTNAKTKEIKKAIARINTFKSGKEKSPSKDLEEK